MSSKPINASDLELARLEAQIGALTILVRELAEDCYANATESQRRAGLQKRLDGLSRESQLVRFPELGAERSDLVASAAQEGVDEIVSLLRSRLNLV